MTAYGFAGLLVLVAMVAAPTWWHLRQVRRLAGIRVDTILPADRVAVIYSETICGTFRARSWQTEVERPSFGRDRIELRTTNTAWRSVTPPDVTLTIHAGDARTPTTCFLRTPHRPGTGNGSKVSALLRKIRRFERAVRAADPAAVVAPLT